MTKKRIKLAENQDPPKYNYDYINAFDTKRAASNFNDVLYDLAQQVIADMYRAGWRKIEETDD